jgi:hypothetical protein
MTHWAWVEENWGRDVTDLEVSKSAGLVEFGNWLIQVDLSDRVCGLIDTQGGEEYFTFDLWQSCASGDFYLGDEPAVDGDIRIEEMVAGRILYKAL